MFIRPMVTALAIVGGAYELFRYVRDQVAPPMPPPDVKIRKVPLLRGRMVKVRTTHHTQTLGIVGQEGQVDGWVEDDFWVVRLHDPKITVKLRLCDMELLRPLVVIAPGTPTSGDNLQQLLSRPAIFDIDRHLTTMSPKETVDHLATLMKWPATRPEVLVLNLYLSETLDPVLDMISYLRRLYPTLFMVVWTKQPSKVRRLAIEAGANATYAKYVEDEQMLADITKEMARRLRKK